MNPFQKFLWVMVLLAAIATAAAGIRALTRPGIQLPNLRDSIPPELAGKSWVGYISEGNCNRCESHFLSLRHVAEKLAGVPDAKVVVLDMSGEAAPLPNLISVSEERAAILAEKLRRFGEITPRLSASNEIVLKNHGEIGDWSLTGEDGRPYGSADLGARIWIADFIFTGCAGPCPLMCDAMRTLVKRLPNDPRLKFVSFSVDPRRDTPEVLREFAKKWEAPERWKFVTGTGVYNLAYKGFLLNEARPAPEPEPGAEFIHSTRFTLVDGRGRMRGTYDYDYKRPETIGPLLDLIERDARALFETPESVVDHAHDRRYFVVDSQGNYRGVHAFETNPDLERVVQHVRDVARGSGGFFSVSTLPRLNALLNGTSFVLLSLGLAFILNKKVTPHKACMMAALVTSTLFLVSYLTYHFQVGSVKYTGEGLMRVAYFAVLISHTALAVLVAPLAIVTVVRAWKGAFDRHRPIARWTLPVWMYVSLTGILVYVMLYGPA